MDPTASLKFKDFDMVLGSDTDRISFVKSSRRYKLEQCAQLNNAISTSQMTELRQESKMTCSMSPNESLENSGLEFTVHDFQD